MKKIIKKLFNIFGFEVRRLYYPELVQLSFNEIYKKIIRNKPIIFDVGANQGQSIERFNKIFKEKIIHAFEPITSEFEILKNKFSKDKNIFLNNFAIGEKEDIRKFYITAKTSTSSFYKVTENTSWLKLRSKQWNTTLEGFTKNIVEVKIDSLDNYCEKNNIEKIDVLKIDTQGYEDKVLAGCKKLFSLKRVNFVELEITFSDIYENSLSFYEIEKFLIKENYRLFANDHFGNLYSNMIYQMNLIYINKDFYDQIK